MTGKKSTKPRIMIVDDDQDVLDISQTFLVSRGYEVIQARSAEEALKEVKEAKPNLILLDVMMPNTDGFWLCRAVKSDAKFKDIPIIFLTAKDDAQSRVEGQKCGGDDYLTKPFDLDALELHIKAQLKRLSKAELVEKIENILDIPEPRGFLTKLDLEELSVLLNQIEARLKPK